MSTYRHDDSVLERHCRWIDPRLTAAKLASLVDAIRAVPGSPQTAELHLHLRPSPRNDYGYRLRCSEDFTMVATLGRSVSFHQSSGGLQVQSEVRDLRDLVALVKSYGNDLHLAAERLSQTKPRLEWKIKMRDRAVAEGYAARVSLHHIAERFARDMGVES